MNEDERIRAWLAEHPCDCGGAYVIEQVCYSAPLLYIVRCSKCSTERHLQGFGIPIVDVTGRHQADPEWTT